MPRLSALAQHGVVFDRAYTVYPESIRSLYALLCGRDPALDAPAEVSALAPCAALPAAFSARGYQTGLFHSGRFGYLGMDAVVAGRGFDTLEDAGAIGGRVQSSFGVDEASTVQRVLAWIDARPSDGPFFAMYLPAAGHHPYGSATFGPFGADRDFDRYRNALAEADQALGALLDGLRARQLDERTTVVVIGDHSEAFGQHPGNFAHSSFLFEENVRVPFVIAAPGLFDGTTRVGRVVSALDTAPTILDLAGMPLTPDQAGRSLLQPAERPALFFTDYMSRQLGLRDGCHKVIADLDARRTKLFDLCRDPAEREDLSATKSELTAMYVAQLHAWRAALSPASADPARTSSDR
jgi:arylsulfatase A-like enzyme